MRSKKRLYNRIDEFVEESFGGTRRDLAIKIKMDETHLAHIAAGQDLLLSTARDSKRVKQNIRRNLADIAEIIFRFFGVVWLDNQGGRGLFFILLRRRGMRMW